MQGEGSRRVAEIKSLVVVDLESDRALLGQIINKSEDNKNMNIRYYWPPCT